MQIVLPLEETVEMEKANIRIEESFHQGHSEFSQAVVAKASVGNSVVVGASMRSRAVTSVRATQIQAFDESVVKLVWIMDSSRYKLILLL